MVPRSLLEAVLAFVLDALAGGLFDEFAIGEGETAALDHESVDHAVEHRAVVVFLLHVTEEVLHGDRGLFGVEFQHDVALVGFQADFGDLGCGGSCRFFRFLGRFAKSEDGKQGEGKKGKMAFHRGVS